MTEPEKSKPELLEDLWIAHRGRAQLEQKNAELEQSVRAAEQALEELRTQVRQLQKSEVIGKLAGGVAHDFNNLLTVISGYSEILLADSAQSASAKQLLNEIKTAGDRAAAITRQLLAFTSAQAPEPRELNLNVLITDFERVLRRLIGEDVTLTTILDPELGKIHADPGQIEQIIIHLAVNARDGMPQGGALTLETRNAKAAPPQLPEKSYVLLLARDTGAAMDPETLKGVFDEPSSAAPGFASAGMNIGLAAVASIVRENGGAVSVESAPGRGTTFRIFLPSVAGCAPCGPAVPFTPRGTETILLVEDEECVRAIAGQALRMWGYTVLEASSGTDALATCEKHAGAIALVIADVVMPGIGGPQLVDMLLALRPTIKALFLSGYTEERMEQHGLVKAKAAFLQKPFTPATLAQKVREVLDA